MSFNNLVKTRELINKLNAQTRYLLCFGGTSEGRALCETDLTMIYSVVSEYGEALITPRRNLIISQGKMFKEEIIELLKSGYVYAVVDASHPFAESISTSIKVACEIAHIPLARFSREVQEYKEDISKKHLYFSDLYQVVKELNKNFSDDKIFVSTGVKSVEALKSFPGFRNMRVRILPSNESIQIAKLAGLRADQLICKKGPFSFEDNLNDFQDCSVLITKESGVRGGFSNKIKAADKLTMTSLIISRPKDLDYTFSFTNVKDVYEWVKGFKKD